MLCALIKESVVVEVKDLEDDQIQSMREYEMILDVSNMTPIPEVGWLWNGQTVVSPSGQPLVTSKRLSRLKFLERFTDTELAGIEAFSSQSNPYAYAIRAAMRKQIAAQFIDLALTQTQQGVMNLVGLGLLTADRANAILNTPVSENEKYKGD